MPETLRVFAGDCSTKFDAPRGQRLQRGRVVVLAKPDRTLLVHDASGYQPLAWLTRADSLTVESDDEGFAITARDGDQTLRVRSHGPGERATFPASAGGSPVGECPDCGNPMVRTGGDVVCLGCEERYGLPSGATVTDGTCEDCGLPTMRVARGEQFELCIDYACDSLADHVREALDGAYDCPDCGESLRVVEHRGRTFLGCDAHPDCETSFSIPAGETVGTCVCGLPLFETSTGVRCLDGTCEHHSGATSGP
ncbi:topoisomerase DNA-binding C4 zinc finger domain-containing protein [Halorarum halobium]|uniref:topoisomerase DNA-binding C4 zinc finger domain-containing protein n=1 Tax=Halorarum halobium TaxID=3075121 RepID=UPI0028AB784D|nr:topoisomerase DNA-binding C4 zinc finger domain-containing protein [Halobaculum sp. XH14]